MTIKCKLTIRTPNIEQISSAVNPDNSIVSKTAKRPIITFSGEGDYVEYEFSNFESVSTIRNTLDDLLTHLDLAIKIKSKIMQKRKND